MAASDKLSTAEKKAKDAAEKKKQRLAAADSQGRAIGPRASRRGSGGDLEGGGETAPQALTRVQSGSRHLVHGPVAPAG
jgi:hypothetical protein